ncbi:hypothetical protein EASAB2608_02832 [Streptomyces sp. EAS-AB2608]|nr:hypothetical protein EASAB2608_02832 [Streptomyces sp. EAS-AB2608]
MAGIVSPVRRRGTPTVNPGRPPELRSASAAPPHILARIRRRSRPAYTRIPAHVRRTPRPRQAQHSARRTQKTPTTETPAERRKPWPTPPPSPRHTPPPTSTSDAAPDPNPTPLTPE